MLTHFCINIVQFKLISLQFAVIILGMIPGEILIPPEMLTCVVWGKWNVEMAETLLRCDWWS